MCFKPPKPPDVQIAQHPVQPTIQNEAAMQSTDLPAEQKIVDPDDAKDVDYGTSKKDYGTAQATGADELKIDIASGEPPKDKDTGGLNV